MATSGYKDKAITSWLTLRLKWVANSQSIVDNTTNVTVTAQLISSVSEGKISSTNKKDIEIIINGTSYPSTCYVGISGKSTKDLFSKTVNVAHDADGTKSCEISCTLGIDVTLGGVWKGDQTVSETAVFDTIPRAATTKSVPKTFTDEQNPTITFDNPAGFELAPYFNVYKDGVKVFSLTRAKGKYSSPYTFTLTDAERTAMQNACNAKNEYEVWMGLETYNGSTHLGYHSLETQLVIVNANPTYDESKISWTDTDTETVGITGNNQIVQSKSALSVICDAATGVKGATIKKYEITLNGVTKEITTENGGTASMGAVTKSGTLTLYVKVTDSRDNDITIEKEIDIVPYSKPILSRHSSYGQIVCERCDENGAIDKSGTYLKLIVSGTWYSLLNKENGATVDVQITGKNYESAWINVPATALGGGSANGYKSWYDINTVVEGVTLDVSKSYVATIRCIDEFGNASDETTYTDISYKIPTQDVCLHLGKNGNMAAFGKRAEIPNALEIAEDWSLVYKGVYLVIDENGYLTTSNSI